MGNKVVVVDALPPNFSGTDNPDFKSYQCNAKDFKKLTEIFQEENPRAVFYLAGPMNLRRPATDPLFTKDLDYLERLSSVLVASHESGVENIVLVSSGGAIYQDAKIVPTSEDYPAHPTNPYALANLQMEDHASMYAKNKSILMVIARLGNVYGPRQWESGFIPAMITKILAKQSPVIRGDGNQTRDFIFIDDAVDALLNLESNATDGVYNVGSGREASLNEVFGLIKELTASDVVADYQPFLAPEPKRSGLDISKVIRETGWSPQTSIKEGILKTIDWYAKKS